MPHAEKQRGGDVTVGPAIGDQPSTCNFGGWWPAGSDSEGLAGSLEFGAGLVGLGTSAQLREGDERSPEGFPGGCALFGPVQPLAVAQLGLGQREWHRAMGVPLVGLGERLRGLAGSAGRPWQEGIRGYLDARCMQSRGRRRGEVSLDTHGGLWQSPEACGPIGRRR